MCVTFFFLTGLKECSDAALVSIPDTRRDITDRGSSRNKELATPSMILIASTAGQTGAMDHRWVAPDIGVYPGPDEGL